MPQALHGRSRVLLLAVPLAVAALLTGLGVWYSSASTPPAPVSAPTPSPTPEPTSQAPPIHVAMTGRDTSSGGSQAPLRTIGAAIAKARAGGTVVVHTGSYHEELKIENRDRLKIIAAPRSEVWLDGSVAVTDWAEGESMWVASGWRTKFDRSPTYDWGMPDNEEEGWVFVNPEHRMAAHPDQVWVGSNRQEQVESLTQLDRDSFFVDYGEQKLYLGSDPGKKPVRASTLTQALRIRSAGVVIRGIGVRNYAPSVPHMGAVTVEAPSVTLDTMAIVENATTGVHVLESGVRLTDVTVARNGMIGLTATHADGLSLAHVVARENNLERFNSSPAAGGVKIGRTSNVVVSDSTFTDNFGTGLWFDESVYNIGVFGSRMTDNTGHGMSLELSGKADVANNVFAHNDENGVKINDTDDVRLWNNTFVDNNRPINVVQDNRDIDPQGSYRDPSLSLTWQSRNVELRNNVVSGSTGNCLVCVEDYSDRFRARELNVTAAGNVYHRSDNRSPKWLVVWARGPKEPYIFANLGQFRGTVGQETPGLLLTQPAVVPSTYAPTEAVLRSVGAVAQPMPDDLASRVGVPAETKHLGAWRN